MLDKTGIGQEWEGERTSESKCQWQQSDSDDWHIDKDAPVRDKYGCDHADDVYI